MKVLFLITSFNSLAQRAWCELRERGHQVTVELALSEQAMIEAAELAQPDLIIAPMLKERVPAALWRRHKVIIVHPGVIGDRGPSSLDWAIQTGERRWGVTLLEAVEEMDSGDIWASHEFEMKLRPISKSSLYRGEVSTAAMKGMQALIYRFAHGSFEPRPLDYQRPDVWGRLRPGMRQSDRAIRWSRDTTAEVVRKIRAADSWPGVHDVIGDHPVTLFGAHEEDRLRGEPGAIIALRHGAICFATADGAVWITHLKSRREGQRSIKLPAIHVLGSALDCVPVDEPLPHEPATHRSFRDIRYREEGSVGYLHFDFYNGAMSTDQCRRLADALRTAKRRPTRVLALLGGRDFWSNGIHLNVIEAAESPANESWANINAIDDVVLEILTAPQLTIAALQGNAGAGGVMVALAADQVFAWEGVVLNPHYRSMGGLYGSEYWTYSLPKRVGAKKAKELTESCLPISARESTWIGLIDDTFGSSPDEHLALVRARAQDLARHPEYERRVELKRAQRAADEALKPLARYREEELAAMHENFFGEDRSYHEARRRFVMKERPRETPANIALHRRPEPRSERREATHALHPG